MEKTLTLRRLTASLAGLVALVGGGLGVAQAGGGDSGRPHPLIVRAGSDSVRASQGSYCTPSNGAFMCADFAYPLRVRGRLEVRPGKRVILRPRDRKIGRMRVELLRVQRNDFERLGPALRARELDRNKPTWRVRLPRSTDTSANRLSISVKYGEGLGDSNWWAGLKLRD